MTDKEESSIQIAVRLPESWLRELDDFAKAASEPGRQTYRADVHRMALRRGLDLLAKERKKRG
jgi:hypothetical protein